MAYLSVVAINGVAAALGCTGAVYNVKTHDDFNQSPTAALLYYSKSTVAEAARTLFVFALLLQIIGVLYPFLFSRIGWKSSVVWGCHAFQAANVILSLVVAMSATTNVSPPLIIGYTSDDLPILADNGSSEYQPPAVLCGIIAMVVYLVGWVQFQRLLIQGIRQEAANSARFAPLNA